MSAWAMLGVTRQGIHDLVTRGKLDRVAHLEENLAVGRRGVVSDRSRCSW